MKIKYYLAISCVIISSMCAYIYWNQYNYSYILLTKCDDHVTGELLLDLESKENLLSSEIINLEELCSKEKFTVGKFELIDLVKAKIRVNNKIIAEKTLTSGDGLDTDRENYYSYLKITNEAPYINYESI